MTLAAPETREVLSHTNQTDSISMDNQTLREYNKQKTDPENDQARWADTSEKELVLVGRIFSVVLVVMVYCCKKQKDQTTFSHTLES